MGVRSCSETRGVYLIMKVGLARRPRPGPGGVPTPGGLWWVHPGSHRTPNLWTWPGGQNHRTPCLRGRPSPTRGHGGSGRDRRCRVPTPLSCGPDHRWQGDHGPSCAGDLRQPLRDLGGHDPAAPDEQLGLPFLPGCRVDLNATSDDQPPRMERDHSQSPRTPRDGLVVGGRAPASGTAGSATTGFGSAAHPAISTGAGSR